MRLFSQMSLSQLGGGDGNDIWGWTDSASGREFALFGRTSGTAFVEITDPRNPEYLGNLPSTTGSSIWRDIKTYQNYAYVVSDNNGPHGLQVFNLNNLLNVNSPQTFSPVTTFNGFRSAHNVAINEDTGYAYIVGSDEAAGGLYIVDLNNPTNPTFAGQFASDGYTHDTQVVTYTGPDATYNNSEIAFSSNTDTLTIADVTNKSNTSQISRNTYSSTGYAHQGWLSEDQQYFYMNDELDELNGFTTKTRTHVWDVSDLDNPDYLGFSNGTHNTIDHNLYVDGGLIFEANYTSGLRILEQTNPAAANLTEVAFFDTYPGGNGRSFDGAWSVYPFFESGTIVVSDIDSGLFVLGLGTCDIDGDGVCDLDDIDLLTCQGDLASGTVSTGWQYDFNRDQVIDGDDLDTWLLEAGLENGFSGAYLSGDANLDGVVDFLDFNIWASHRFQSNKKWSHGDFDGSGTVDFLDFNIWAANRFQSTPTLVPEPGACVTASLALLGMLARRRLKKS